MWMFIALAATSHLTPLIPRCDPTPDMHMSCDSDLFKPVWKRFDSETGEIFRVDTAAIELTGGGQGTVYIYFNSPGARYFDMSHLQRLHLTCDGRFAIGKSLELQDAPPMSVIGQIASWMCPIIARREKEAR